MRKTLITWFKQYWPTAVVMILCVVFSLVYTVYANYKPIADNWGAYLIYGTKNSSIIILAAIGGLVPALTAVLIIFTVKLMLFSELTYTSFIYLLLALSAYVFSKHRWYRKPKYLPYIILYLTTLSGPIWGYLLELASGTMAQFVSSRLLWYGINALPEMIYNTLLIYALMRFTPDSLKRRFPMESLYLEKDPVPDEEEPFSNWTHHISNRVTLMVLFMALIIAIYGALAATNLIPSLIGRENASPETLAKVADFHAEIFSTAAMEQYTAVQEKFFESDQYSLGMPTLSYIVRLLMLVLSGMIPIAVICNYYARTRMVNPLIKMSEAVEEILNTEDPRPLEERAEVLHNLEIDTGDEIEILYHGLNRAAEATIHYVESLEEKKRLEQDLEIAKATNQARSTFLSNMSHEIRTPINAIIGMDEIILRETREEFTKRYARDIQNAGKSLLSLINDVLDFSKIDAGKMDIVPVEYDLVSLVNDVVNLIMIRAKDKGLDFFVSVDPDIPQVMYGDEIRIKQCIINILNNAVKYTDHGSVTLEVRYRKTFDPKTILLTFTSRDTGIGIKPEDMAKIQEAYQRIDEFRNYTTEGTGLGISITEDLLRLMGSHIDAESEYGKGSTFGFTLEQKVINDIPIGDFDEKYDMLGEKSSHGHYEALFQAPKAKVLIVDDTRANLIVAAGLLKHTRMSIETVLSGAAMLKKAAAERYDLIFLDYRMPEMDGIEALTKLREMENCPNADTPVIALTANAISGAREMFIAAGFSNYLSKPIQGSRLEALVEEYLPAELVIRPGDPGYVPTDEPETAETEETGKPAHRLLQAFFAGSGMNYDAAVEACGGEELLPEVLASFVYEIPQNVKKIKMYLSTSVWKEYTVLVHALKNSARLIGASELSHMAKELEDAGNSGDTEFILRQTPDFLSRYQMYSTYLAPFLPTEEETPDLPPISEEDFRSALSDIRECAEGFDFASAAQIVTMLKGYSIPDSKKELFSDISHWVQAADRHNLLTHID